MEEIDKIKRSKKVLKHKSVTSRKRRKSQRAYMKIDKIASKYDDKVCTVI